MNNNLTVIMKKDLGKYLFKGDIVNIKAKDQTRAYKASEYVTFYKGGRYIGVLSLAWFLGGRTLQFEMREAHAVDITDLVGIVEHITQEQRETIKMLYPEVT